jgi:hypothetical protein
VCPNRHRSHGGAGGSRWGGRWVSRYHRGADFNPEEVLHALYCRLDDLASRINAGAHNFTKMEALTITRKPAEQKIADAVKGGKAEVA